MGHLIRKDSVPYAAPACVADRSLCPHGANSPIYAGLQANNIDEPLQPLAPMPFATPLPASMPPPPTSTTMRTSILTLYTSPATSTPSAVPTPSMDPMLRGNPTPPWHLHTSTIIGIAANGVLAISIIPLLIFGLVMKWRLKKAKAFQLGQGPRRVVWDEAGWRGEEERRRQLVVDDVFVRGFRKRAEGRGGA